VCMHEALSDGVDPKECACVYAIVILQLGCINLGTIIHAGGALAVLVRVRV
jgi:hypothetical protein